MGIKIIIPTKTIIDQINHLSDNILHSNMEKTELRSMVKTAIELMNDKQKNFESAAVFKQLEHSLLFINSKTILCYWAMDDEIDTKPFMQKWLGQKKLLLPSIKGDELEIRPFNGIENMQSGQHFHIPEPIGNAFLDYKAIDLVIVPGRAFDAAGHRMGRGLGFYDRVLKNIKAKKIGVCFKCQIFENVPTEEHDIQMDIVLHI